MTFTVNDLGHVAEHNAITAALATLPTTYATAAALATTQGTVTTETAARVAADSAEVTARDAAISAAVAAALTGGSPTVPTLGSSWVSYDGGATFSLPNYRLMYGAVWCGGFMKSGALGVVFTLPAGMRPLKTLYFDTIANAGVTQMSVSANGDVRVLSYLAGGTNASVSLNGIQFPAEQ